MAKFALVATLTAPLSSNLNEIRALPEEITWLQLRADLAGDIPTFSLRNHFPGKLLYTLRSARRGGAFSGRSSERSARILAAAQDHDLVELEAETDLTPELLRAIPPAKRMVSWSGAACDAARLRRKFQQLAAVRAHSYCMTTMAEKTGDGLQTLLLLKSLGRDDVTAFAEGPSGVWSRLLAPYVGAPFIFGQTGSQTTPAGEPSVQNLIADYGFPLLRPVKEIYGMVGNRIFGSPSPRLHNAGYRGLHYPALFVPFHVERFEDFWQDMVLSPQLESLGLPIRGLTIVSPHKEAALAAADAHSPMVSRAAASNIFVFRNGVWEAHTTDPESIAAVHAKNGNHIPPRRAAVIGCGGAGRAVAAALQQAGVEVTLVNRGKERGDRATRLLGLPFVLLSEFQAEGFTLLVNATPIGREDDSLPFALDSLGSDTVVVDLAYGVRPTPLVAGIQVRGGTVIDGYDVALTQVRKQFQMMVGQEMPHSVGREVILSGSATHIMECASHLELEQEAFECNP